MVEIRFENGKRVIERWDEVFEAASDEARRQLIVALLDAPSDESVTLPGSAMNPNVPVDSDSLTVTLCHRHLPMLAARGFVEWERDPFVAFRGPRFEEIAVVFEALHGAAVEIPDSLVIGCQRLERERQRSTN